MNEKKNTATSYYRKWKIKERKDVDHSTNNERRFERPIRVMDKGIIPQPRDQLLLIVSFLFFGQQNSNSQFEYREPVAHNEKSPIKKNSYIKNPSPAP